MAVDLTPLEVAKMKAWYGWPRFDTTIDPYCKGLSVDEAAVARDYIAQIEAALAKINTEVERGNIKRAEEVEFFGPSGYGLMSAGVRRLLAILAQFLSFYPLVQHFGQPNATVHIG